MTLFTTLLRLWLFVLLGLLTTFFPLYILTEDKIYFFTRKKILKKFHLGGIPFARISRIVKMKFMNFLSLDPHGAVPILCISKFDRDTMIEFLLEKEPHIKQQNF